MMTTTRLWRVVSVWMFVAVICWYASYVWSTESCQEPQRPLSSQDVSSEEETVEKNHHYQVEESWLVHMQSSPQEEQLMKDDQQNEHQAQMDLEVKQSAGEEELDRDKGTSEPQDEPELGSEHDLSEAFVSQDQDSASVLPLASGFAADCESNQDVIGVQENIPNSVSDDAFETRGPEVTETDPSLADHDEETNPYDSESPPPVIQENTANAHTTGTKTNTEPPLISTTTHSSQPPEANTSHMLKEQELGSPVAIDMDSAMSCKDPEDIPTFDEWKRKMMEVEKEKSQATHTSTNVGSPPVKKIQKNFNNYASVECGAKILGANPESKGTSAILMENMDLYMLNPCSNKIWFIIELCEPIQVKQLDIANFELFSSTPKDFLVSISDRYPTNKWLKLGTFHARDERTVQSFPLDEQLYAKYVKMFTKYIKVELLSHFGAEHFCPLSLIRVFGTSMVEEYEEIADPPDRPDDQDDDLDYPTGYAPGEVKYSKNLIGSAKDVILNMVNNIAVNVLGGGSEMQGNGSVQEVNISEPVSQLETTTENLAPVLDSEEVEIPQDPDTAATADPSSDTADPSNQGLPPVEEKIVVHLDIDEEESITSTIILLDKEEELDEEQEKRTEYEKQLESLDYCPQQTSFLLSPYFCCCSPSFQEHLQRQCSAQLSKKRKFQIMNRQPVVPPHIQEPTWHLPPSTSACPATQLHPSETPQLHVKEQAAEQDEKTAGPPNATGTSVDSQKETEAKDPVLEPSQTSSLSKPTFTDSSSDTPPPVVVTPQIYPEEPTKEPRPEKNQDVLDEEKHVESSAAVSISITADDASVTTTDKLDVVGSLPEINSVFQTQDLTEKVPHFTTSVNGEHLPTSPTLPKHEPETTEVPHPAAETVVVLEHTAALPVITETKVEDLADDVSSSSAGNLQLPQSSSSLSPQADIYAEPPNGTEQNGNQVHGSNQKESVFMRLNNRIKALEMNMSLSGRYLEQLSQRYRRQMEEMQKAFNKTIVKLQNTSRIAEEQDQRQTDSIQLLQGQLQNMTQLVLNLSVRVVQLRNEVSDGQNYLMLSLMLCVFLGLLLCANHCRFSMAHSATAPHDHPMTKSSRFCCPERQLCSCDDGGLKRSASYPLLNSFQVAATEDPELLHSEETQSSFPANRKRRRRKLKPTQPVETLKPFLGAASELSNGTVRCNGALPVIKNPTSLPQRLLQPAMRASPSDGSSEGSSQSDDPSFCGIAAACTRICDGLPPPESRAEKRAMRRRRSKPSCVVVDFVDAPHRDKSKSLLSTTMQDMLNRKTEQSSGTFGLKVTLSGPL
ncbi:SUN domain-containing ossification factor-like isoform X2 [Thalassophryne amazonica]|uniref:SUN domain-containing ossification factor-like isoform X2 n=1 Tax=Thalassophryne amazonica TaxID=390379 RepID=UPI001471CD6E|nr:SUN domain-containing ossification factor-like isoform X2 [Thalassophryne amazonica]